MRYELNDKMEEYEHGYVSGYEWIVTYYTDNYYDGRGEAITKVGDILYLYSLEHCSCYGPLEDSPIASFTIEEFLSGDIQKCSSIKEVNEKVLELLNG